jgi:hypothetical protein
VLDDLDGELLLDLWGVLSVSGHRVVGEAERIRRRSHILEVVRLLGVEVLGGSRRHGGGWGGCSRF